MRENGDNDSVDVSVPQSNYGDHVKYEVVKEESYPEWDSHVEIGDNIYAGVFKEDIPNFDQMGIINVIEPDYNNADIGKFDFPPELIVDDDNRVRLFVPRSDGRDTGFINYSTWACVQCGNTVDSGDAIVGDDIESREPNYCRVCENQRDFELANLPEGTNTEDVLNLFPTDGLVWQPPSAIAQPDIETLFDDVREFIYNHWEGDDYLYDGLAAYAISTWIRPELDFVPHLLITGSHESGKTRLLNTLKEVSYRCIHTAAPSSAALFRAINDYHVTLYLSEYHDLPDDVQDEVDAVLKAGQKRGEVAMRATESAGGGYTPKVFDPFTHVSISTQFTVDDDMESRCFTVKTSKASREMPRQVADADQLRNRLMGFRARVLASPRVKEAQQTVEDMMDSQEIYNRLGEKLSSVLLVAELCNTDISEFVESVVEETKESKGETEEAAFTRACMEVAYQELSDTSAEEAKSDWSGLDLKLGDIRKMFNDIEDRDVTSQYIGQIRHRLDYGKKRKSDGVYISMDGLKKKLKEQANNHGVDWEVISSENNLDPALRDESISQETRIAKVKKAINYQEKHFANGVPLHKVITICTDEGLDANKVTNTVDALLEKGEIYEPQGGHLLVT